MGLDISAWSHLKHDPAATDDEYESAYDQIHKIYKVRGFDRLDGYPEGLYRSTDSTKEHGFRAGSYSGYNRWRQQLSRFAFRCPPEALWEDATGRYQGKPFEELINFSDAEGAIGPKTAAKLASDFRAHAEEAAKFAASLEGDDGWFIEKYADWQRAFELAADGGFVKFH